MLYSDALHSSTLIASLREIARALSAAWDVDTTLDLIARKTAQVMRALWAAWSHTIAIEARGDEKIGGFWDTHDFTDFDDPDAQDVKFEITRQATESCARGFWPGLPARR